MSKDKDNVNKAYVWARDRVVKSVFEKGSGVTLTEVVSALARSGFGLSREELSDLKIQLEIFKKTLDSCVDIKDEELANSNVEDPKAKREG